MTKMGKKFTYLLIIDLSFFLFSDQALDLNEFEQLLKSLFSFSGDSYYIQKPRIKAMFNYFDENKVYLKKIIQLLKNIFQDDKIQLNEFTNFWFKIVKMVILYKGIYILKNNEIF